jgi:hypothetical protein
VDATRPVAEFDDGGEARRRRQGLEQIYCTGQSVSRLRVEHAKYIRASLYKEQAIDPTRVFPLVFATIPDTLYGYLKRIWTSPGVMAAPRAWKEVGGGRVGSADNDRKGRRAMFRLAKVAAGMVGLTTVLLAAGCSSSLPAGASSTRTMR